MADDLPCGDKSAAELMAEGWERRASYDRTRIPELQEIYEDIGYEVYLKWLDPTEEEGCAECMKAAPEKYCTLFTRKK